MQKYPNNPALTPQIKGKYHTLSHVKNWQDINTINSNIFYPN